MQEWELTGLVGHVGHILKGINFRDFANFFGVCET